MNAINGFTMIDNRVIDQMDRISGNTLKVYVAIRRCVNESSNGTEDAFPARSWIMEKTGLSENTVKNALNELKDLGAITIQRRFNNSSIYHTEYRETSTFEDSPNGEKPQLLIEKPQLLIPESSTFTPLIITNNNNKNNNNNINNQSNLETPILGEKDNIPSTQPKASSQDSQCFSSKEDIESVYTYLLNRLESFRRNKLSQEYGAWEQGVISTDFFKDRLSYYESSL